MPQARAETAASQPRAEPPARPVASAAPRPTEHSGAPLGAEAGGPRGPSRALAADDALLRLTQWLSPAFPLGSYAYSHGLETAVARGEVRTADDLRDWIHDVLAHGSGIADAVLLCAVLRGADPADMGDLAAALAPSAERWRETAEQGRALAGTLRAMGEVDLAPGPLPVVLGLAARPLGLPAERVAALFLQAFAGALVSAGVRLIPLGQAAGQGVLAATRPLALDLAARAAMMGPDEIAAAAFGADLASMVHETLDVRIFRS